MIFIASLVMGMLIIAFFSIIFYLIKPAAFMFIIKRKSVSRLWIIGYWTLYLFSLLILMSIVIPEDDSSFSLLGFFLGIAIQILFCIFISKKNNIKIIKDVMPPNLLVVDPPNFQETYPINKSEKLLTQVISSKDIPIVIEPVSGSLVQTTIKLEKEVIVSVDKVVESGNIFITQGKQLEFFAQVVSKQEKIFKERQRLISILITTLFFLKKQKEFEEKSLKFIQAETQVQKLLEEDEFSFKVEIGTQNFESKKNTQQLDSSIFQHDEEVFATYCLESKNKLDPKIILLAPETEIILLKDIPIVIKPESSAQAISEHEEIFEKRQRLLSTLEAALLSLKQKKVFEEEKRFQFIKAETQVQKLLEEHKASLNIESYSQNFESKQDIPQLASRSIQDYEDFTTFQLESENDVKEEIIPSAPEIYQQTSTVWVPSGKNVQINGLSIYGGMFYLGTKRQYLSLSNEPSYIDIALKISNRKVDQAERLMGYWPSYSQISPEARRAYLDWLVGGKCNPTADIGYVFLFFYGLERRALIDAQTDLQAKKEIPEIINEVNRLLSIYGSNNSFKGYASRFIDYVSLDITVAQSYLKKPPKVFDNPYELPLSYRIAFGQLVIDKYPLPVDWALAWVLIDRNISKRTPVTRCADYFAILFKQNYQTVYGDGFVLSPNRTKLKITYFPASSAISRNLSKNINDLPDVSVVSKHIKKLQELVDQTTEQLEPYSRYLGRNPDSVSTSDIILFLPINLWSEKLIAVIEEFKEKASQNSLTMELKTFLMKLDCNVSLSRNQFVELVRNLENVGLGIEPDILIGSKVPKPNELIVLFKIKNANVNSRTEPAYNVANITLDLASTLALAEGEISEIKLQLLKQKIESWKYFSSEQHERLKAILQLKIKQPSSLVSLKKKLELLSVEDRKSITQLLVQLAQVDGVVKPAEVKILEQIYGALQLEKQQVYKDLHASSTNIQLQPMRNVFTSTNNATKFNLDVERIASLQEETALVSTLLANVFVDEAIQVETDIAIESEPDEQQTNPNLLGLDIEHSAFLRRLITRPQWTRDELLNLAADFDLMLDGALENINESALDNLDEQIIEGDDLLEVNQSLLEKIEI